MYQEGYSAGGFEPPVENRGNAKAALRAEGKAKPARTKEESLGSSPTDSKPPETLLDFLKKIFIAAAVIVALAFVIKLIIILVFARLLNVKMITKLLGNRIIEELLKSEDSRNRYESPRFFSNFFQNKSSGSVSYRSKPILTPSEQNFYYLLQEALQGYIVISQVQIIRFVNVMGAGRDWKIAFEQISRKSVDFLICSRNFSVIAAIELQDKSHLRPDRQKSDEIKRAVLRAAGVRLVEYYVSSLPTVEEIRRDFITEEETRFYEPERPTFDYSSI